MYIIHEIKWLAIKYIKMSMILQIFQISFELSLLQNHFTPYYTLKCTNVIKFGVLLMYNKLISNERDKDVTLIILIQILIRF